VLGCKVPHVKSLVFRARSGLIERRQARETPCEEIREQLANLRGGALRRSELRHHLRSCAGCRAYREEVGRQRQMLAVALPVVPSLGLKQDVLAAVGAGGSASGAALSGLGAAVGGPTLAKLAVVGAIAGGGAVAGDSLLDDPDRGQSATPAGVTTPAGNQPGTPEERPDASASGRGRKLGHEKNTPGRGRGKARQHGDARGRGPAEVPGSRGRGAEQRSERASGVPRGRAAPKVPPATPPVRRGPPAERPSPVLREDSVEPLAPAPKEPPSGDALGK
jgi:hypothetical protein